MINVLWGFAVVFGIIYLLLGISAGRDNDPNRGSYMVQSSVWIATSFVINAIILASPDV